MSSAAPAARSGSLARQRRIGLILRLTVAFIAILFSLFPVFFIISAAFNPTGAISTSDLIPVYPTLKHFRELFSSTLNPFPLWLWNSLKVSGITAVLSVMITALAAYAFSRFRFKGRRNLLLTLVLVQVFPNLLAIVSLYLMLLQIGSYIPFFGLNSHAGLILVYLGGTMGMGVWLMKGFFDSIPRDLDESAKVDGASDWQIFWRIIFPLVRPILAVIGILNFIGTFNDFILASVLLQSKEKMTFMVGLYQVVAGQFNTQWGLFAAGAIVGALPIVILYLVLQDQIVGGLTAGAVKG